jgi:uncharacterized protein YdeI (YjbR/CyaY-like superfamily)
MTPMYFASATAFRTWLDMHHDTVPEILMGLYKKAAARRGITYPEALDEALCYGWIDGIRKRLDDERYTIRFTPRRPGSRWSLVNTKRVEALSVRGRMAAPGLKAFEERTRGISGTPTNNARIGSPRPTRRSSRPTGGRGRIFNRGPHGTDARPVGGS